jgi:outer membrane protein assembly factor BamB
MRKSVNTLDRLLWRVLLMVFVLQAHAEDWPQFLGPRANGISGETNLLEKWPTNGPPLVWQKSIGTGYSAPSVRDGLLVLHHRVKDEEAVEAFDAASGTLK